VSGVSVLEQLEAHAFDLVLMDVQMPVMDGIEATKAIRRREQQTGGRQCIVALTAHARAADRDLCVEAGMDGYISKPIDKAELLATIHRLLPEKAGKEGAVPLAEAGPSRA
jgi:CheY-like chemotaxis protein